MVGHPARAIYVLSAKWTLKKLSFSLHHTGRNERFPKNEDEFIPIGEIVTGDRLF